MQAVSHGGLSPAEGASKLVACLQDMALNGSAASPTQAIPMRPQLTQSQPSSDFTLSPSSLPRPPPPPESLLRRPEAWEGNPETHSTAAFGARQSDVEVPAPKKKTAVSGDEKLKSWMNAGLKVAAPTRSHYYAGEDGFVHATNPTSEITASSDKAFSFRTSLRGLAMHNMPCDAMLQYKLSCHVTHVPCSQ